LSLAVGRQAGDGRLVDDGLHEVASALLALHRLLLLAPRLRLAARLRGLTDDGRRGLDVHVVAVLVLVGRDAARRSVVAGLVHPAVPQHPVAARLVAPRERVEPRAQVRDVSLDDAGTHVDVDGVLAMRRAHAGMAPADAAELLVLADAQPGLLQLAPGDSDGLLPGPEHRDANPGQRLLLLLRLLGRGLLLATQLLHLLPEVLGPDVAGDERRDEQVAQALEALLDGLDRIDERLNLLLDDGHGRGADALLAHPNRVLGVRQLALQALDLGFGPLGRADDALKPPLGRADGRAGLERLVQLAQLFLSLLERALGRRLAGAQAAQVRLSAAKGFLL